MATQVTQRPYTTSHVTSKDDTAIGYRQMGYGPGLILVHGGMQAAQNLMKLASMLAEQFTVYVPDLRGRGLNGPYGENYSLQKAVEDIHALLTRTETHFLFGLIAGGIITLRSVMNL